MQYPEGQWAPIVIETLIHVHVVARPLRDAPAVWDSIRQMHKDGLIEPSFESPSGWHTTERGEKHLLAMCTLPYPKE